MNLNKEVNNFGIFGSVVVVNSDLITAAAVMSGEDEKQAARIAAQHTSETVRKHVDAGEISALEGLILSLTAGESTDINIITPDKEDIKAFIAAVVQTAEDGNMSHIKDYVKESGNDVPQDIWDYIYELTNK